ncbi:MAG: signal peptide peptidase SppA [Duncaniella sp.]|nr:signal peptide peptidase SppA [Duncaniella sp.]
MKKFWISFLGALGAIWFSLMLCSVLFILAIGAAAALGAKSSSGKVTVEKNSYLVLNLAGQFNDRPGRPDVVGMIMGEDVIEQVVGETAEAIRRAASDKNIEGIFIDCQGAGAGLAQRQTIVEALRKFKADAPDKWIYAYADEYSQGDYYIAASVADSLFLNPVGGASISGLASMTPFFKGFLDKIGVEMQVVKVGTYKSAVEPFILKEMSEPSREQQQLYLDNIWSHIAGSIAEGRDVTVDSVNAWADSYLYGVSAEDLVSRKVVDALCYRRLMNERLASLTDKKKISDLNGIGCPEYFSTLTDKPSKGSVKIAVYYACGDITDSEGEGIVAEKVVPDIIDMADNNDDIDGLVLYVNSGGGSAFASEQIWESLEYWKKKTGKPFYVSMSDVAASGGYYISCGADKIFAQPTTLTGSIGIFGMIPNASGLINDKLGVNFGVVKTNKTTPITITSPLTPAERAALQSSVDRGYELFTSRCAEGRHMTQDSIKLIAEGRVWDGAEALRIGLVDELGGLEAAVADMAKRLSAETWQTVNYPEHSSKWYDILLEAGSDFKTRYTRSRLGELAPYYDQISILRSLSGVQARMPLEEVTL